MSTNLTELYRTYNGKAYELDRKISTKDSELYAEYSEAERAARRVRTEARTPIDEAYTEAVRVAADAQREGRKESDEAYTAAVNAAEENRAASLQACRDEVVEEKKAVLAELLPEDVAYPDVVTWMFTTGTWGSYPEECRRVLEFLEAKKPTTLAEVNAFGRKIQGWCGTYTTLLLQAVEGGALTLETTPIELAQAKAEVVLSNYGVNSESRKLLSSALSTVLESAGVKDDTLTAFVESLKG